MSLLLSTSNISLEYPTKKVLESVSLGVNRGDHIGIVGSNGSGKSSLLGILAGTITPDEGEVFRQGSVRIGVLHQRNRLDPKMTVHREVLGDIPEYVWASDKTIRSILDHLLDGINLDTRINTLSGGQRRRVERAKLLVEDWDILILDEPTNHLDIGAIHWLAQHLKNRYSKNNGAFLIVTHDRWFLDEVCTTMWEVHNRQVDPFEGGYSAYILQRVERDRVARVTEERRRNMIRKELAWLSRGAQARSTKPKFRIKAAQELIANVPEMRNPIELKRLAMTRLGKKVIDLVDVSMIRGEKTIIDDVAWLIGPGDRFAILGDNGAGKTTLLDIALGTLTPTTGSVSTGKTVRTALLSQHLHEMDDLADDRVRVVLARHKTSFQVEGETLTPSKMLERLGFGSDHLNARIADLSGGQKRQLGLILAMMEEPNVLILDEPGNDLDTDMLAALEDLLDSWPGTLLLVSHDRHIVERMTDHQYALIEGTLRHLPGGVDEYLALLEKSKQMDREGRIRHEPKGGRGRADDGESVAQDGVSGIRPDETSSVDTTAGKPVPLSGGELIKARRQLASVERKLSTLETKIEEAKQRAEKIDPSDYQAILDHNAEMTDYAGRVDELETEWVELSEKIG
jgi:ATPase subunit of ABC transporter with duplicated ATPase domains